MSEKSTWLDTDLAVLEGIKYIFKLLFFTNGFKKIETELLWEKPTEFSSDPDQAAFERKEHGLPTLRRLYQVNVVGDVPLGDQFVETMQVGIQFGGNQLDYWRPSIVYTKYDTFGIHFGPFGHAWVDKRGIYDGKKGSFRIGAVGDDKQFYESGFPGDMTFAELCEWVKTTCSQEEPA